MIAIAKYIRTNKDDKKIIVTGEAGTQHKSINSNSVVSQTNIPWQNGKANLQITNKGSNVLFVRIINEGQPLSNQTMPVSNNANILQVAVNYITANGQSIDVAKIKQGTDFIAKVTVTNPGKR